MSYEIEYQRRIDRRYSEPKAPARLVLVEDRPRGRRPILKVWRFLGGYGDDSRRPTQEGCAKLAAWMDVHEISETPLSLIEAFDRALNEVPERTS